MEPTEVHVCTKWLYTDEFCTETIGQRTIYDFGVIEATTLAVVLKNALYQCVLDAQ